MGTLHPHVATVLQYNLPYNQSEKRGLDGTVVVRGEVERGPATSASYSLDRLLNAGQVELCVIAATIAIGQPDEKRFGIVEVAQEAFGRRSKKPSAFVIGQFVPAGRLRRCIVDTVVDIERVPPNGLIRKSSWTKTMDVSPSRHCARSAVIPLKLRAS